LKIVGLALLPIYVVIELCLQGVPSYEVGYAYVPHAILIFLANLHVYLLLCLNVKSLHLVLLLLLLSRNFRGAHSSCHHVTILLILRITIYIIFIKTSNLLIF